MSACSTQTALGIALPAQTQGRGGNVDLGNLHFLLNSRVHLAAAATGVQQLRTLREVLADEAIQLRLDDRVAVDRGNHVVDHARAPLFLVPVLVPVLRIDEVRVQLRERLGQAELLRVENRGISTASRSFPRCSRIGNPHLGMTVGPLRQRNRDLAHD